MKSVRPKDEDDDDNDSNGWSDFRGTKRTNDTHASKTDSDAKLMKKGVGREAKLCYEGHALMENRNALLVDVMVTEANGYAEPEAAVAMLDRVQKRKRITLGADRGYDAKSFVGQLRARRDAARCPDDVTPFRGRRAHHSPSGLRSKHSGANAD